MTTPINLRRGLIAVLGAALLSTGLLALIFGLAGKPAGAVTQPSLNDGLVAYYPFNGVVKDATGNDVVKDATGNGHDGTLEGGANTFPTDAPPPGGSSSLSFDGSDDAVSVPDDPALDFDSSTPMTISLWAKKTSDPGGIYHILSKREEGCGAMNYQLARDANGFAFASHPYPETLVTTSVNDLTQGEWTHLAVTYAPTSSTLNIYADGQLIGSDSTYDLGPSHSGPLKIGAAAGCPYNFGGLLDEVKIYNRALSAIEIGTLAKPSTDEGLIAYYPFSGDAKDATGHGHDGTRVGSSATFSSDVPTSGTPSSLSLKGTAGGSDDYVSVPDDPALDFDSSTPMTISLWAKKNVDAGVYHILGKRDGCGAANYQLAFDSGGFHFNSGQYPGQSGTSGRLDASGNSDLTKDEWTHLAVTYDASHTLTLYEKGANVGSANNFDLGGASDAPLEIGASGTCSNTFPGLLDEVRIYNRALGEAEIGSLAKPTPSDATPPTTTATPSVAPNGAGWNKENVTVTLNATDNEGGSDIKEITYSVNGGQPTTEQRDSVQVPVTTEGENTIVYYATDTAGNIEEKQTTTVKIDKTAPAVSSTSPANNATGVSATAKISAAFLESGAGIDPSTVITNTFQMVQVKPSGNVAVSGTVSYDAASQTVTFTPSSALAKGAYQATITTKAKDKADNALTNAYTWSFSTGGPSPRTSPRG